MQIKWLELFEILAASSSVEEAAQSARCSSAILIRAIKNLEATLNARFFDYGPDGRVSLTNAGMMFRSQGARLLEQFERAATKARDVARGVTGVLRVGLCEEASTPRLIFALKHSRAQLQGLKLQWHEMSSARLAGALRANMIDIALLLEGVNLDQLVIEPMWQENWVVILPRALRAEHTDVISATDLQDINLVMTDLKLGPTGHDMIRRYYADLNCPLPVAAQCLTRSTMLMLTLAGVGATFVPASLQNMLIPTGSPAVIMKFGAPSLHIFAAYRADDPPGGAMQFLRGLRLSAALSHI